MQIKIVSLPTGWYACQVSDDDVDFFKTSSLYPSLEAAYIAVLAYDKKGIDIDLPKGGDIKKLREKVEEQLKEQLKADAE